MDGLLVIDKPSGPTSHQVVQEIRRLVPGVKVGHAGTLDPAATGILLVCLGKATRLVEQLMDMPKGYRAEIELGAISETGDAQGEIIERRPIPRLDPDRVLSALASLSGRQEQIPPGYSAVKYRGKPLYYWTRRGIKVEPKPRTIHIYRLELIGFAYPRRPHLTIEVECSRGTYIRTLAEQIGERLGTGAFISALERHFVGPFTLEKALGLTDIENRARTSGLTGLILPPDQALPHLPALVLRDTDIGYLQQGRALFPEQDPEEGAEVWQRGQFYRVYDQSGKFKTLAVAEPVAGELRLKPELNF